MIRISREDYECRVLETLRSEYIGSDPVELTHEGNRITVESIEIDKSDTLHRVSILFREESRLKCLFGFQEIAVEAGWDPDPTSEIISIDPSKGYWGPVVYASTLVSTYFMEQVEALGHGLPPDCDPEKITWVTGYRDWNSVKD